jgi:hypothetical protein
MGPRASGVSAANESEVKRTIECEESEHCKWRRGPQQHSSDGLVPQTATVVGDSTVLAPAQQSDNTTVSLIDEDATGDELRSKQQWRELRSSNR